MIGRYWHLFLEGFFVLGILLTMKHWIFPFFIRLWYPTTDVVNSISEWLVLLFGVVTSFVYFGLGSIAKTIYQLSKREAFLFFSIFHIPLLFVDTLWRGLLHDVFALFMHNSIIPSTLGILICGVFFFLGRGVKIIDEQAVNEADESVSVRMPSHG